MRVIGMMSGTSYDGVDAAAADLSLDGDTVWMAPLGLLSVEFPPELRARIASVLPPATTTIGEVCRLDTELGRLFGETASRARDELAGGRADLVVSHGQTVFHWVDGGVARGTLQLGAAAFIAGATGVPVVSDLRTRDLTRGGQAAPLVPVLDALLLLGDRTGRGALNLGGIANITVRRPGTAGEGTDPGAGIVAYDIGPANALIDAAVVRLTGGAEAMDRDGRRARRGTVQERLLRLLLDEPYYARRPPKSTGKELFHGAYLASRLDRLPPLPDDDVVATVTELTAVLVARACREHQLTELVVAGGGVRNPALMARIGALAAPTRVSLMDDHGIPAQAKEAYLFALLGFLTVNGLPGTISAATGADRPSILGSITPGDGPLRLPDPYPVPPRRLRIRAAS